MRKPVSIVILTCGALDYLKFCIESIQKYTNPSLYRLIVINNGSKEIKRFLDDASIDAIHNEENRGFAATGRAATTGDIIINIPAVLLRLGNSLIQ